MVLFHPTLKNHLPRLGLTLSGNGYGDSKAKTDKSESQWFPRKKIIKKSYCCVISVAIFHT